jgi:hypothetical protein
MAFLKGLEKYSGMINLRKNRSLKLFAGFLPSAARRHITPLSAPTNCTRKDVFKTNHKNTQKEKEHQT